MPASRRPRIALSFDDGWLDNWLFATPVLRQRNLQAILAVSLDFLQDGTLRKTESDEILYQTMASAQQCARQGDVRAYANLSELKAMVDSGVWRLEAHGSTHQCDGDGLSLLARPQNQESVHQFQGRLRDDVLACCRTLKTISGHWPRMFFWPWGHYSRLSEPVIRQLDLIQFGVWKGIIKPSDRESVLPRIGVSARWRKFYKNCLVFRNSLLRAAHAWFSRTPSYLRQLSRVSR